MAVIIEGNLKFSFPHDWNIAKYDEWSFYRNQFQKVRTGVKAIDILALGPGRCTWFIEVKDYRVHPRTKVVDLAEEVAEKICDTLAALLPASVNANDTNEKRFARKTLASRSLRVVLHLEQPGKHSKLFPRAIDPAKILQRLKQLLKAIDAHPKVLESGRMDNAAWTVN
jgi:hypothetical protein